MAVKPPQDGIDGFGVLASITQALRDGRKVSDKDRLDVFCKLAADGRLLTTTPLLPLILNLRGQPYSLVDHFPFEPFFNIRLPAKTTLKTGRQLSKTTSQAASGLVLANSIPYFTILYINPLFEQISRFSNNYVGDFINESPVKKLWTDSSTRNNVLQRSFKNHSKLIFSFALLDSIRIRGVGSDLCAFDEVQLMNREHLPIVEEAQSYSKWALSRYSGTPRTLDNILETLWLSSSQAEWFVPCFACGRDNIPSNEYDLQDMIGPARDDISEALPGTLCANKRCRRPINPRFGRWVHHFAERRFEHAGYHVPQIILPAHYADPRKWSALLGKRNKGDTFFNNEVLGESHDVGSKLINLTDLLGASRLPWKNNPENPDPEILRRLEANEYPLVVLGIDWGGGGKDEVSYTKLALVGWRSDGMMDCLWGRQLTTPQDHVREALQVREAIAKFRPHLVAHDFSGAGTFRETMLVQTGVPVDRLVPVAYVRSASRRLMHHVAPSKTQPRHHWQVDKSRSLLYTCNWIKLKQLRFFAHDYVDDENRGLIRDFLALIDLKIESRTAADSWIVTRQEGFSDDFAHAVNVAVMTCWHTTDSFPDFGNKFQFAEMTPQQLHATLGPPHPDRNGVYFDET